MASDTGRCINCGFLCKRRTVVDAESIVYTATSYDRENGTFYRHSGWPEHRDMPTQPACFRNIANLQKELVDALALSEQKGRDAENTLTLEIIKKSRECKIWYPWTELLNPKEHLDNLKEEQNRKDRKYTDRIMRWLTIALVFFALVQIFVVLWTFYKR
jgi:hypothetical protein